LIAILVISFGLLYSHDRYVSGERDDAVKALIEYKAEQKALAKQLEDRLQAAKDKHQEDLERHKKETDREFERVNKKLDTQNTVLIEVKTMVTLLVADKIKK